MYDDNSLTIDLNGIGSVPESFNFVLADSFFATQSMSDKLLNGYVEVSGSIARVSNIFRLQWEAKGTINVPCDLCLDEVATPIEIKANYQVEFGEEADETEDRIILLEGEHQLNIGWYICESIVLGLPITNKHNNGDCNSEMAATLSEYLAKENSLAEEEEWN